MRVLAAGRTAPTGTERYYPLDPTLPRVAAQRPLALAILADYGVVAGTGAQQVRAIMDWVARIAIHGHSGLRLPQPYTRGTATLPAGETWATAQAKLTSTQQDADNVYWTGFNHDGTVILDKLLGTLNIATGVRAADGAMSLVAGSGQAHYRYNNLAAVRSVWCTHEHNIATVLLASIGKPSMLAHQTGHDPLRVQYGERGEWGLFCSTYNETFELTGAPGVPLDNLTLRDLTQAGRLGEVTRAANPGPSWDPLPYVSASYLADRPEGWPQVGVSLDTRIVPGITGRMTRVVDDPTLTGSGHVLASYTRTADTVARPYLGAYLLGVPVVGSGSVAARVASGWPGTTGFQMRAAGGAWTAVTATTLPGSTQLTATVRARPGQGLIEVAPVDASGQRGPAVSILG